MSVEYLIPRKHTLKILYKSKHFPRRYKKTWVGVFFWTQCSNFVSKIHRFRVFEIRRHIGRKSHKNVVHSHLTPPVQRGPANIRINLTLLEAPIFGLHFCRRQYGSVFIHIFVVPVVESERHEYSRKAHNDRSRSIQGHPRSLILVPIESAYAISY